MKEAKPCRCGLYQSNSVYSFRTNSQQILSQGTDKRVKKNQKVADEVITKHLKRLTGLVSQVFYYNKSIAWYLYRPMLTYGNRMWEKGKQAKVV